MIQLFLYRLFIFMFCKRLFQRILNEILPKEKISQICNLFLSKFFVERMTPGTYATLTFFQQST